MESEPTHISLRSSASNFFDSLKKVPPSADGDKSGDQAADAEIIKIKLVLEEEFGDIAIEMLKGLPFAPPFIPKGTVKELKLGLKVIKVVAKLFQLEVTKVREKSRIVELEGSVAAFEKFFKVSLDVYKFDQSIKNTSQDYELRGHTGDSNIPIQLQGIVHSIIGLQQIPQLPMAVASEEMRVTKTMSASTGHTSEWMADLYKFPKESDGTGQHIGIITAGGGFSQAEFDHFFEIAGFPKITAPKVVLIEGALNEPGSNWLHDYEISTDYLVAACAAQGAKVTIYFCKSVLDSFMNTVEYIIDEGEDGPNIISYSWGCDETSVTNEMVGVNRILKEAAIDCNKTIFCSSGDFGSSNNSTYPKERDELTVIYPAASPWVTSCGGTMFSSDPLSDTPREVVWNAVFLYGALVKNATGGGFSAYNLRPDYQIGVIPDLVPTGYQSPDWVDENSDDPDGDLIAKFKACRGVPDVAGHASVAPDDIGYWIYFQGKNWLTGGTSAVAPLWAALTARLNQRLEKHIGFFNPYLYEMAGTPCFNSVNEGHNGLLDSNSKWDAGEPWNPCTGLGTPNGEEILKWMEEKFEAVENK